MFQFLRDLLALASDDRRPKPTADKPLQFFHEEAPLPDGWPLVYGAAWADGKHVVTVNNVPTMAPRWDTEEDARRDAWDRHWADERNAKALADYEAKYGPVKQL